MSALDYLATRRAPVTLGAIGCAFACTIASVCGCAPDAVWLMAATLALAGALALTTDYLRSRRFLCELDDLAQTLEQPWQLHSLMGEPAGADQEVVLDALRAMGRASAREVAQAKQRADEHRSFVEGWVHDVKAPLASCELVAKRVAEPERSQLERELDRIDRKVASALWYARADCAGRDYAIREVPLVTIPRAACRDNARFLIEHGCVPQIDVAGDLTVLTDRKQAVFIVSQLVENAAKYGASHLRVFADTRGDKAAGSVSLVVEDDGLGIPAAEVGRVFERGFTGTRGREHAASTGMGLFLAARLCDQLGLELEIESDEGEGCRATLTFPLDRRRLDAERDRVVRHP